MPREQLLIDMSRYNEELVNAGLMLAGEGLHPSAKDRRVRFAGSDRTMIDGPFPETREIIASYWLWQVRSMDEPLLWVRRCPNPHLEESEIEIRPVFESEDFGEALTPGLREHEDRRRARLERDRRA